jgi:glycosyltransferase involved in cell wall biosynthesis
VSSVRASVVIPARDAAATLPAALDALAAQEGAGPFEVIVVDDGSTDATRAVATEHPVVTRVVDGQGRGPGAARNAGVALSTGPVIAFTDADCAPDPGWLAAGLEAMSRADLVQGRVEPDGPVGPWDRTVSVGRVSHLYETANLLVDRRLFERLGGFEPWLTPRRSKELAEDVWLGWRARRAGARVVFASDAVVRHAVFPGTPRTFVAERARLRFFPEMARRVPELRSTFFFGRVFLNRRSAAFDLAVAGVATRRPAVAALAAVPYVRMLRRQGAGMRAPGRAGILVAADAVGFAALVAGSIRARSPLL